MKENPILDDVIHSEDYTYRDVLVGDRPHCAIWAGEKWWLMPIRFKFGGCPFLGASEAVEISEADLDALESITDLLSYKDRPELHAD